MNLENEELTDRELTDEELADALAQADVLARISKCDAIENASKKSIVICFLIKYAFAIAMYMLLRWLDAGFLTDVWIALVFAEGLYGREKYVNIQVKREMISQAFQEMKDEESKDAEDIEESSKAQA